LVVTPKQTETNLVERGWLTADNMVEYVDQVSSRG
jgi:hypothetical protein